ncbi:MAG: radical SAM protein [Myxococcales bacterium]|nr:radical SAM protein [Myxococcales bacterium]
MEHASPAQAPLTTPIERFVWDLTYACPLRCVHCLTESGRRPAAMLDRDAMLRVVEVIVGHRPLAKRMSFGGGEPLLAPWWDEAARLICDAGIPVTLFTSGWSMELDTAERLARSVAGICVSVDGPDPRLNDPIRGRPGAFDHAMATLELLDRFKRDRSARGEPCYSLGIDYTVTRSNREGTDRFVSEATARFPGLDFIRFGAVVPEGLAQEEAFVARELLTMEEVVELSASEARLASLARNGVHVSVTDARGFLPDNDLSEAGEGIAHIEASGSLRAFTTVEAKVGSVLEEPLELLWQRALAWRREPFVQEQMGSIRSVEDWARAIRTLDRRYGSEADRIRIARRGTRPGGGESRTAVEGQPQGRS